jgi:signal transduction histidine kinase
VERLTAWERIRRVNPYVWDGLLAVGVFGLALLLEILFLSPQGHCIDEAGHVAPCFRIDAGGRGLLALACAPLVWRRRAPMAALAATSIAIVLLQVRDYPTDFAGIAFVVAAYSAAAYRARLLVLTLALPIAIGAAAAVFLIDAPPDRGPAEIVFDISALVGLPMVFGRFEFNRRRRNERDLDRAARDAVAGERGRISRELHDVVAHAMGVMVVQAGAARVVLDRDPEGAEAALRRIEDTGRTGLVEMRRLLEILETGDGAARAPQPGLERLDDLLETMRASGLPVEAMWEGSPHDLPPGLDLTAYRVVQEALTNALKHAGPAHARVVLRYAGDSLEVEIADDGRGPPPEGAQAPGHGLIGMRERVALFGGSLETGARPGGGFVVRARIPLAEAT